MRGATGLLLAVWILLMGYQYFTVEPKGFDGVMIHYIGGCLLLFQLIAWMFVFKVPKVTCGFLVFLGFVSLAVALVMNTSYYLFAVINAVFAVMSYGGHRELVRAS
ncbi:hypothetical protein [Paenibacillus lemnae]|uniref:DUF4064 domain-containing protein n=1 Tax=Paenibacillus lemnae TaxID=1330551 RepID=A0A848M2Z6_PAELE|nr:hypothetical protein [Paenibacillus lemnae]NMO95135.1 hypothetical protein [Paenibacillus lemnae]